MTQSNQKPSNKNLKRASVPGAGGSITVEAALSVPIFFFAVICLIYFIEIHNVQTTIQAAAVHAAKICTCSDLKYIEAGIGNCQEHWSKASGEQYCERWK